MDRKLNIRDDIQSSDGSILSQKAHGCRNRENLQITTIK